MRLDAGFVLGCMQAYLCLGQTAYRKQCHMFDDHSDIAIDVNCLGGSSDSCAVLSVSLVGFKAAQMEKHFGQFQRHAADIARIQLPCLGYNPHGQLLELYDLQHHDQHVETAINGSPWLA